MSAGFDSIQRVMAQVTSQLDLDRWMYGNVYDTKDGSTPLNWWVTNLQDALIQED